MPKEQRWTDILLEERRLEMEQEKIGTTQREIERLDDVYQEHFYSVSQLFFEIEEQYHHSSSRVAFEMIKDELDGERKQIFQHFEEEQEQLHQSKRMIEDKQDDLFYEKQKLILEAEAEN